jgi:hypothetical protein
MGGESDWALAVDEAQVSVSVLVLAYVFSFYITL